MDRLIIALFFASITITSCQQSKSDKGKEKIISSCDKFMEIFAEGKFNDAMQKLKEISVIDYSKIDTLAKKTNNQMINIGNTYGRITSYEFIAQKTIKDFLIKRTYLLRFEQYYLRFNFTIYKSNSGWKITNFVYDEEIDDLFN